MKVLFISIVVFCFSLTALAQEQAKEKTDQTTTKPQVTFKQVKVTPDPERIKARENEKRMVAPVHQEPRRIEVVKKADSDSQKPREYKAMGHAETSGPPVELSRTDLKTTATKADLLRALNDPQPIRPQNK